jgi:hypothetical protein
MLPAQGGGRGQRANLFQQHLLQDAGQGARLLHRLSATGARMCRIVYRSLLKRWGLSPGCPAPAPIGLREEGEPLPDWHYLICGDREAVHRAGESVRGWTVDEAEGQDIEDHLVSREI